MRRLALVAALGAALLVPSVAHAGGLQLRMGVAESDLKPTSLVQAKANLTIARLAGFDSLRYVAIAWPKQDKPDDTSLGMLGNIATASRLNALRLYLAVYNDGGKSTPLTDKQQDDFASYAAGIVTAVPYIRDVIVGNEPNLNQFWQPQYTDDGGDAAAPAYLSLLAKTYDALKAVSPRIQVIGGALAPRGSDNPLASSKTHSPTTFIRDLGAAYRDSGRAEPLMDAFAIHPYEQNSSQPPSTRNGGNKDIALADYDKLVQLLGTAFDGTAQKGSTLPIVYGEFGVESQVPPAKQRKYTDSEPASVKAVPQATQAAYYRQALQIAYCQPNVEAMFLFHLWDEKSLKRWQSGLYYADHTPRKVTLAAVRKATAQARRGVLARCAGLKLVPRIQTLKWPRGAFAPGKPVSFQLRCSIDCAFKARIVSLGKSQGKTVFSFSGRVIGKVLTRVPVRTRLAPGRYRLQLSLVAPLNPGRAVNLRSPTFSATGGKRKPAS
jgi:hypothetical protein